MIWVVQMPPIPPISIWLRQSHLIYAISPSSLKSRTLSSMPKRYAAAPYAAPHWLYAVMTLSTAFLCSDVRLKLSIISDALCSSAIAS